MKFAMVTACCLLFAFCSQAQSQVSPPTYVAPAGAPVIVYRPAFSKITGLPQATNAHSAIALRPLPSPTAEYPPSSFHLPATTVLAPNSLLSPGPVTVYSVPIGAAPFIASPTAPQAVVPTPLGRPFIIRTKVYIPGQPIRNLFRAITP